MTDKFTLFCAVVTGL